MKMIASTFAQRCLYTLKGKYIFYIIEISCANLKCKFQIECLKYVAVHGHRWEMVRYFIYGKCLNCHRKKNFLQNQFQDD